MATFTAFPQRSLVLLIKGYQYFLSPWLGRSCRFFPSCSHYAIEAIEKHGSIRGSGYVICRLLKCHPFHPGGIDLVP